jgi:hypothetical protein
VLSLRGFDRDHQQVATAVVEGAAVEDALATLFSEARVSYVHVHNAGPGCFAVRVDRREG